MSDRTIRVRCERSCDVFTEGTEDIDCRVLYEISQVLRPFLFKRRPFKYTALSGLCSGLIYVKQSLVFKVHQIEFPKLLVRRNDQDVARSE